MTRFVLLSGLLMFLLFPVLSAGMDMFWSFPVDLPPDEFGNLLIDRISEKNGVKPVSFSHWTHRLRYTCRVCHFELEFNMKVNTSEITEAANKAGMFCGTSKCHDGKAAFGHEEPHCTKCHNGDRGYGKEKYSELSSLPKAEFGNKIDWVSALNRRLIRPVNYLSLKPSGDLRFRKTLSLEAEWANIPPAIFPHKSHIEWLDCNICHPDIFNIQKKTTKHFEMLRILKGEFCGVCHMTVAFPMRDCKRCHPGMRRTD